MFAVTPPSLLKLATLIFFSRELKNYSRLYEIMNT